MTCSQSNPTLLNETKPLIFAVFRTFRGILIVSAGWLSELVWLWNIPENYSNTETSDFCSSELPALDISQLKLNAESSNDRWVNWKQLKEPNVARCEMMSTRSCPAGFVAVTGEARRETRQKGLLKLKRWRMKRRRWLICKYPFITLRRSSCHVSDCSVCFWWDVYNSLSGRLWMFSPRLRKYECRSAASELILLLVSNCSRIGAQRVKCLRGQQGSLGSGVLPAAAHTAGRSPPCPT